MIKRFEPVRDFFNSGSPECVKDNGITRTVADVLNELHDRLLALESRADGEDTHQREQQERE
jgi:flagellar capping protein FliD